MGQMYNQVNDRFNELSPPKTEEQAYEQISKESEIEDDDGNMVPVYTPDELKEIKENDNLKEAGKLNIEGKDYVVKDGDVMHFRFNV